MDKANIDQLCAPMAHRAYVNELPPTGVLDGRKRQSRSDGGDGASRDVRASMFSNTVSDFIAAFRTKLALDLNEGGDALHRLRS